MDPFDALWLAAAVRLSVPLLLAATGELISERAGVLNLGLEGMMLSGAFGGYWAAEGTSSLTVGMVAAVLVGIFAGLTTAVFVIALRGDQVVVGIGINILALGITNYLLDQVFPQGSLPIDRLDPIAIPVLSDIPGIGDALFAQNVLGYVSFGLIGAVALLLRRTGLGLSIRATGQNPSAASAAGVSPFRMQWVAMMTTGAFAGLAGAYLSIGSVGVFREAMTSGRGFIAIAILVFGRWKPAGVLLGALLFGAADALQLRLQAETAVPRSVWMLIGVIAALLLWRARRGDTRAALRSTAFLTALLGGSVALAILEPGVSLPSQLWLAAQYAVALAALLVGSRETNMPRYLATPLPRTWNVPRCEATLVSSTAASRREHL